MRGSRSFGVPMRGSPSLRGSFPAHPQRTRMNGAPACPRTPTSPPIRQVLRMDGGTREVFVGLEWEVYGWATRHP